MNHGARSGDEAREETARRRGQEAAAHKARRWEIELTFADEELNDIYYALGKSGMRAPRSNRNIFVTRIDATKAAKRASRFWDEGKTQDSWTWFHVTDSGRSALSAALVKLERRAA